MSLREKFVLQAMAPDACMTELCRAYGISRKTGYKWLARYKSKGVEGLEEMSRRPHSSPLQTTVERALDVLQLRQGHPTWGPKKLHAVLVRRHGAEQMPLSVRTVARILERSELASERRNRVRPSHHPTQPPKPLTQGPNDTWSVDFKGWWRTRDGKRCEPLTVRDQYSRYVLAVQVMSTPRAEEVRAVFEQLFDRYGRPRVIQCDNGPPFVCSRGRLGLTRLSAWWVSLGIELARSRPACPQDNGAHERMHRDMRRELEAFAAADSLKQQEACERWRREFNEVRPHEALGMKTPAEVYRPSPTRFEPPPKSRYEHPLLTRRVSIKGMVKYGAKQWFVSEALRGHEVGLEEQADGQLRAQFHTLDLGLL